MMVQTQTNRRQDSSGSWMVGGDDAADVIMMELLKKIFYKKYKRDKNYFGNISVISVIQTSTSFCDDGTRLRFAPPSGGAHTHSRVACARYAHPKGTKLVLFWRRDTCEL